MLPSLRDYQADAVEAVIDSGSEAVCLVAPTGSGKTRMGVELAQRHVRAGGRVLWLVHRRELVSQGRAALVAAGLDDQPVRTVQGLASNGRRPEASMVVFDEAHHYVAQEWGDVARDYASSLRLGLTATPERSDGRPLGDLFDHLVVAAGYSDLISAGHLVPCRVLRPDTPLGSDLAQRPVDAYRDRADGQLAFCFSPTIRATHKIVDEFRAEGVPAAAITAQTPKMERDESLEQFRRGELKVLVNPYVLTEGVDVPEASVCILARGSSHVSPYLQMCGRVLRPAPGKTEALLLDLSGASHAHGVPTQDRTYSLDGQGIQIAGRALRVCINCGFTYESQLQCPSCGFQPEPAPRRPHQILSMELREFFDGENTPRFAKTGEFQRLMKVASERNFGLSWVQKEYRNLFGDSPPDLANVSGIEKLREYRRLAAFARERGYKPGFAAVRFKDLFGHWPPRGLT